MREDNLELLEAMFPKGFVIIYIMPNGDPAYCWNNKDNDEFLRNYLIMLNAVLIDEQEENSGC